MTFLTLIRHLQLGRFQPSITSFSSSSPEKTSKPANPRHHHTLTQDELTKINLILPRLCLSNHLNTALHLTITALLTNPPPNSISLCALLDSLASQPDMARSMSLLTRLRHDPRSHRHVEPINAMLIATYFKKGKVKEALKLFNWMVRPGSTWELEEKVCGVLVNGFCRNGMVLEALKVLRVMAAANVVPRGGLRNLVYRGLLREARIKEAIELNEALEFDCDEGMKKALELLDRLIENWSE